MELSFLSLSYSLTHTMSIKIDVVDINNDDYDVKKRSKKLKTKSSTTIDFLQKKVYFDWLNFVFYQAQRTEKNH